MEYKESTCGVCSYWEPVTDVAGCCQKQMSGLSIWKNPAGAPSLFFAHYATWIRSIGTRRPGAEVTDFAFSRLICGWNV